MSEKDKKIGRDMSLLMGFTMSLFLSLVGTATSGHFTVQGWLISFVASLAVSLVIGFVIPVGKVSGDVSRSFNLVRGTMKARLVESLTSNLIYTPILTFLMVTLAYNMAMRQSGGMADLQFGPMFIHSLIITFIVGYILVFFLQPFFVKRLLKKYGIEGGYGVEEEKE